MNLTQHASGSRCRQVRASFVLASRALGVPATCLKQQFVAVANGPRRSVAVAPNLGHRPKPGGATVPNLAIQDSPRRLPCLRAAACGGRPRPCAANARRASVTRTELARIGPGGCLARALVDQATGPPLSPSREGRRPPHVRVDAGDLPYRKRWARSIIVVRVGR
jgi:hypothetical protein